MISFNFVHQKDVVCFVSNRNDQREVSNIIQKNRHGISNEEVLLKHLEASDYIPVLSAVWGEKDKEKRLTWLRSQADAYHVPLMFEQAIAEFVAAPSVDTIVKVSYPLMKAAYSRALQDSRCCNDNLISHGDLPTAMIWTYEESLENAMKKYTPSLKLGEILADREEEVSQEVKKRVDETARATLQQLERLPNPTWVGYHSMCFVFSNSASIELMAKPDLWVDIRKEAAEGILEGKY